MGEFFKLTADEEIGKTANQVRVARNPRKKVIAKFIETVGDKPLDEISHDHAALFRDTYLDRIREGTIKADTAIRSIRALTGTLHRVIDAKGLDITLPTLALRIQSGDSDAWPAFNQRSIVFQGQR